MIDFPMTEASIWTALYCFVFYLFLFILNFKKGVINYRNTILSGPFVGFMLFLFGFFTVTHCMKGDFFHMMEKVYDYVYIEGSYNYGEVVYPIIGEFVHNNYFLFRVIVWGGSFLLFLLTAKRMKLNPYNAAALLILTHAITFSYARATASMAVYFFGLSFLCNPPKKRIFGYVFGITLILLSFYFHRSALAMIFLTVMLLVPLNKRTIILLLFFIFIIASLFKDYFETIAYSFDIDEVMQDKLQNYSDRSLNSGLAATLLSFFDYLSFLIPAFYCSKVIYFTNKYSVPSYLKRLCGVAIGLVFTSFVFYLQGSSYITFYYRILYMSMLPLTFLMTYIWNNRLLIKKQFLLCILPGVFYHFSQYLYSIYLANLGIK